MISWTENVHILSFWNFERSHIGQHGLALGILTQFIDDHQRALCGNVEDTCSLVSMIPASGFTGDFQSNSATPILTWKSGWPYHLVIITCSKKRCSKRKKCNCLGYIKRVLVVSWCFSAYGFSSRTSSISAMKVEMPHEDIAFKRSGRHTRFFKDWWICMCVYTHICIYVLHNFAYHAQTY